MRPSNNVSFLAEILDLDRRKQRQRRSVSVFSVLSCSNFLRKGLQGGLQGNDPVSCHASDRRANRYPNNRMMPMPTENVAVAASEHSKIAKASWDDIQAPVNRATPRIAPVNNKLPIRFNTSDQIRKFLRLEHSNITAGRTASSPTRKLAPLRNAIGKRTFEPPITTVANLAPPRQQPTSAVTSIKPAVVIGAFGGMSLCRSDSRNPNSDRTMINGMQSARNTVGNNPRK